MCSPGAAASTSRATRKHSSTSTRAPCCATARSYGRGRGKNRYRGTISESSRGDSRQIVTRGFDMRMNEHTCFLRFSHAPDPEQRRMFAHCAFDAALRAQVSLHITAREGVEPAQDIGRDGLQTRDDEQQVEPAVELTGRRELSGRQRLVQLVERFSCRGMVGGGCELGAPGNGLGLDLQAQAEDFVELAGGKRAHVEAAIGKDV